MHHLLLALNTGACFLTGPRIQEPSLNYEQESNKTFFSYLSSSKSIKCSVIALAAYRSTYLQENNCRSKALKCEHVCSDTSNLILQGNTHASSSVLTINSAWLQKEATHSLPIRFLYVRFLEKHMTCCSFISNSYRNEQPAVKHLALQMQVNFSCTCTCPESCPGQYHQTPGFRLQAVQKSFVDRK